MDATLIRARHTPPPIEAGPGASHPQEPEAGWTRKGGKSHFGYKLRVGMDMAGLVRNHLIARRRAPVEAVFSTRKRRYGLARSRYATLARVAGRCFAALTMLNLCRTRRAVFA